MKNSGLDSDNAWTDMVSSSMSSNERRRKQGNEPIQKFLSKENELKTKKSTIRPEKNQKEPSNSFPEDEELSERATPAKLYNEDVDFDDHSESHSHGVSRDSIRKKLNVRNKRNWKKVRDLQRDLLESNRSDKIEKERLLREEAEKKRLEKERLEMSLRGSRRDRNKRKAKSESEGTWDCCGIIGI